MATYYVHVTLLKKLIKVADIDLKCLDNWLNANKISLNSVKNMKQFYLNLQKKFQIK